MVHNENGSLEPFDFASIMDHVPSLRQLQLNITVMSFVEPIDSSNVNPEHWQLIGSMIYDNYDQYNGFVVLHGTDTMAYTASALSFMLEGLTKPVIFTGAQLPISSFRSDARENIITAIEIASASKDGQPAVPEVAIYFDSVLMRGNRAKKVESIHFDAFESDNYPLLAEAGTEITYNQPYILKSKGPLKFHHSFDCNVSLIKLYPGIRKENVEAMLGVNGLRGAVIETYGAGNAPTYRWLIDALKEALNRGVAIVNVSQCSGGMVDQGRYATSSELEQAGVIGGADLTTEAALTKLMIVLAEEHDKGKIAHRMTHPTSGELTLN